METWRDPDYDEIASLYAAEFTTADPDDPDVTFLIALSDGSGPALDLGCGAGRLLVPLAVAGLPVTGVDSSAAMLAHAAAAARDAGVSGRVALVRDDFRTLAALATRATQGGTLRFALAYCAQNTFLHMPNRVAQLAALRAVASALRPGGRLVLDLIHPQPDLLSRYYGTLTHEATFTDAAGGRVDRFVSALYGAATQTVHATWFYDRTAPDGTMRRVVVPFMMRLVGRYELELLLDAAGFAVEDIYSDADLTPLHDGADRMLVVAVRR